MKNNKKQARPEHRNWLQIASSSASSSQKLISIQLNSSGSLRAYSSCE